MSIPTDVTLLVLGAALMHASWNAIVKSSTSKLLDTASIAIGASLICALGLPFFPAPDRASWPWLAGSVVLHFLYYAALIGAYRWGDLSHTYPLMRGVAPVLVAVVGLFALDEHLTPALWSGVALITAGIVGPMLLQGELRETTSRVTLIAIANACVIASYTLVDGVGTRMSGNAVSYCLWLFLFDGLPIAALAVAMRGRGVLRHVATRCIPCMVGAVLTVGSYGIVLWAMTRAPVAAIAALREVSVVFATVIGTVVLGEPFGRWRIPGAILVVGGVIALRL